LVLVAGELAAKWAPFYRPPAVASYNSRLAELDQKLSRELAGHLRAAGVDFDAAVVSVEAPACQRAVPLVKGESRQEAQGSASIKNQLTVRYAGNGIWSFAGTGELSALKFDVDAAAEMRRLAESTPPEFPQVALPVLTPQQPIPDATSPFAREIRVVFNSTAPGERQEWIHLEEARMLIEPDLEYMEHPRVCLDWRRTNSLDLCAVVYADTNYWLITRCLVMAPVDGKMWQKATPEDILSHPGFRAVPQRRYEAISPAEDQTDTYLFRTEEGTVGILRLLEVNPSLRQLKIQYKLAAPAAKADT